MNGAGLLLSNEALDRIIVFLLYVPVCLISFRWLIPRLSPTSKRIAIGFLAAQILVIVLSIEIRPTSDLEEWLWKLDHARNIPSSLASAQLALIGVFSLTTAWLARSRPVWQRLYLLGVGLVFPFIGLDDFFDWKLLEKSWLKEPYILVGAVVVVATLAVAMRSPRRAQIWHVCLLTGLSLAALGGIVVDGFPDICGHLGFIRIDECLQFRFLEESLEFIGNWLTLAAILGYLSDAAPTPRPRIRLFLYAMPALLVLLFSSHSLLPQLQVRLLEQPVSVHVKSSLRQEVVPSDRQPLDETQVVLGELAVPAASSANWSEQPKNNGEFSVSNERLIYTFLFVLYVPVGLISFWLLIPHLAAPSARLASVMLAAQVIVIVLSIGNQYTSDFEKWLWNLDQKWNVPSILASTQLALVAGVALTTVYLAKARPTGQRLYLVGIGLVFLFLAWDEYFAFHERIAYWERYYIALGAVVAMATAVVAVRSPRRTRKWHICLLTGLAMSAIGAILFNGPWRICGNLGFLPLNGCLWPYNYEESLEFLAIWLVLVAALGHLSQAVPRPKPRIWRFLYLIPALWILLLIHDYFIPGLELRLLAQPASVQFESGVHLHGFRLDNQNGTYVLRLYASAKRRDYFGTGYSVHLVDQVSGDSIAYHNRHVSRPVRLFFAPGAAHVYRQWMKVEIPPQTVANRALRFVLTHWRDTNGDFVRQTILSSDLKLLSETQVVLSELVLPADSPAPSTLALAQFDNGFALTVVELPERARPGDNLVIPFAWRSDADGQEDHIQFLHLGYVSPPREGGSVEGGAKSVESGAWFVYDHQPLGPRLPTRLWYSGLADSETWQVPLPADLAPGRYTVFSPGCIARAIRKGYPPATLMANPGWMPECRWER